MDGRGTKALLLDSSVIVKWFIDEYDSSDARFLGLLFKDGKIILAASEFAILETSNALRKGGLSQNKVHVAIEDLYDSGVAIFPFSATALHESLEYMYEKGISAYDAYHVAQADLEGLRLITADKKLARAVRGLTDVMTLEEYAARLN